MSGICDVVDGKKTYTVGLAIIAVVAGYKYGYITKEDLDMLVSTLAGIGLLTIRQAISKIQASALEENKDETK